MHVTTISSTRSLPAASAAPREAEPPGPGGERLESSADSYGSSGRGERLKQWAVFGGAMVLGAGIGYGAGVASGGLLGPAVGGPLGAIAGASGGATLASLLPRQRILTGAILGAIAGGILGASTDHPLVTAALTVSGATLPLGLFLAIFSGAE